MIRKKIHLLDLLSEAQVQAPAANYAAIQSITIGRETCPCLFDHPPAAIAFSLKLGQNPLLQFGYGIKQSCWQFIKSKVYFYIYLKDEKGKQRRLFKATLKPGSRKKDHFWKEQELDLSRYAGQAISITFQTLTKWGQTTDWCWSGWSDPLLTHEIDVPTFQIPKVKHPLILLISGDALRADHLGCYGHPIVKTPYIDELANDSSVFTHARSQSPCTLGSYASMLTGLNPSKLGIHGEWGVFPSEHLSLPQYLRANGFHTIFAPSEEELVRPSRAMVNLFDEVIPSMANPAQDGAITTRQVIKRLEKGLDGPSFMWIQYFDTHPPHTPEKSFSTLYYHGDPADKNRYYQKQMVSEIRGMESCLEIKASFEMIEKGFIPHGLYQRLRSTARVFRGDDANGPDLADHLVGLGESAYMHMSRHDFSLWLDTEAECLLHGVISPALHKWLITTLKKLEIIEAEIISWLDDVVDYRYPLSQYMSAVSYFDHQIGQLTACLKEQQLYDQTMIVVTSPHGELLGEYGIPFYHHLLAEEVLRVPMIIKPPKKIQGKYISGIFDIIDLFPTIIDAFELPIPLALDGTSRYKQILSGEKIPDHDSIAVNYCETISSIVRGPFIFLKAHKDYYASAEYQWKAGDKRLFSLNESLHYQNDLLENHPELVQSMESSLDENTLSHTPVLS